ncbi:MAG: GNAT family N-acetyltransferase [Myxococcales bacterium]|jgi:acyl-CoA hydrolase/GNAT superfamily N-acetyltransferase
MNDETIQNLLQRKKAAAEDALSHVSSGQRVFVGSGCAAPQTLVRALCDNAPHLNDVEVVHLLTAGKADYVGGEFSESFRHNAFFIGPNVRDAVRDGQADYTPIFLSEIPHLIRSGQRAVDVALISVSPPDRAGYCSMGINVDIQRAACDSASLVVAEVNPRMPRTFGDSAIHLSEIDYWVEVDTPLIELEPTPRDEVTERIGAFVARLVDNGACLQAGIGGIPAAALRRLTDKRDLGVHTEMFTEALLPLIENGNVTNKHKAVHPGKTVTSFVMGSRALYDFLDDNPGVSFFASDHVNDPRVICQNDRVVAINSALQVDLTGQVCADSMGHRFYSGIGGQVDFVRGAAMSRGGKPIIALPSTAKGGSISRIVPTLDEGAGVVTSRGDVHYVVTEYGVAYLHGKTIRERALSLIGVAHPDFRPELLSYVKERHYVHSPEAAFRQAVNNYPAEVEHTQRFGDERLVIRPLKTTDERALQEFFYSHEPETIRNRHFTTKKSMPKHEAAALCSVDYQHDMAIGAFRDDPASELVAVARYSLDPDRNMAETAVVVHEQMRRRGIATYLMRCLESYAHAKGIRGFYSEIMPSNSPALSWRRAMNNHARWDEHDEVFTVEYSFEGERRRSILPAPPSVPPAADRFRPGRARRR